MLMNHTDALMDSIMWGTNFDLLVVQKNSSTIRLIETIQHFHQRGFSGTIFA